MILAKLVHTVVVLMFIAMAFVQLNDPDPIFWVAIYIAISFVPITRLLGYRAISIFYVAFGMCLVGLFISAPGFIDYLGSQDYAAIGGGMSADKPYAESAREFLGMLIGAVCLMFYGFDHLKS
ncbi:MAG: transmembrane 220 family protein [Arenicellaceae bacterium]|nr:transmembrane 220 family protein [Arenicellaceae bacterium]